MAPPSPASIGTVRKLLVTCFIAKLSQASPPLTLLRWSCCCWNCCLCFSRNCWCCCWTTSCCRARAWAWACAALPWGRGADWVRPRGRCCRCSLAMDAAGDMDRPLTPWTQRGKGVSYKRRWNLRAESVNSHAAGAVCLGGNRECIVSVQHTLWRSIRTQRLSFSALPVSCLNTKHLFPTETSASAFVSKKTSRIFY